MKSLHGRGMESMFRQKNGVWIYFIILILMLNNLTIISAEKGSDIIPNLDNTPLENLTFTTPSTDLSEWELTVSVSESAENISKLKLETQICVYDPILCHAPEIIDMTNSTNSWSGSITTLEKHSYVNWRIHIIYEDESEILIPERSDGYAKVWSGCWEIMENQTIISGGELCENSEEENVSGFPLISALLSLTLATIFIKKNQ
tara:strand:- start:1504 stop:2115 length:612 start_codon:yes stop_codon:yes gene_type:complete